MALVYIRPDADTTDGNWVNQSASNTDLYDSVNESVASDADYIRSENNPTNDIVKLRLSNFASTPIEPMTVRYRFKKVVGSGEILSMKARLVQGSTTIAEWEHEDVDDTYVDAAQELTSGQFALISDFTDLYLEFEAISGLLEIDSFSASYLLTDEDSGFSINAMSPGDTVDADYVGQSIGGSVSATSYTDAPLDASNLTQAGTSPKMVHWSEAPYVRWTPHNVQTQSQTFDNAAWTKVNGSVSADATTAPDGTSTADKFVPTAGSSVKQIYGTTSAAVTDQVFTVSVYLKASGATWARVNPYNWSTTAIWINLSTGAVGTIEGNVIDWAITDAGSGWYRVEVTAACPSSTPVALEVLPTNADNTATYTGDGSAGIYLWGAQANRGYTALPYLVTTSAVRIGIPQAYDVDADAFGILIEPAATNLIGNSEEVDTGMWTASNVTVDDQFIASPDGSVTADKITANAGSATHEVYGSGVTASAATAYTLSAYFKQGTHPYVVLKSAYDADEWFGVVANLATGAITHTDFQTSTLVSSSITPIGDDWYRVTVTGTHAGANPSPNFQFANSATPTMVDGSFGNVTWTAAGTETFYVWGLQLELGTVATSHIPTVGSTVTRATDNIKALTSTTPFSATEGTVYIDAKRLLAVTAYAQNPRYLQIHDTTSNERIDVFAVVADNDESFQVYDGGVEQFSIDPDTSASGAGVRVELTAAWKLNDFDASSDGQAIVSSGTGTLPTVTTFQFGDANGLDRPLMGYIYRFVYVPAQVETRDADLELWRYAF